MNIYITEEQFQKIQEGKSPVLSNNGSYFGQFGWCLIVMGAPGVGKNYFMQNNALISGKVFDFDEFKMKHEKMLRRAGRKSIPYNELRAGTVSLINNSKASFFKAQEGGRLNNVIFYTNGRPGKRGEISLVEEMINTVVPLGYKVILLWVVCNRSVSMVRNISRGMTTYRKIIPDRAFHNRTNQANSFAPSFLQSPAAAKTEMAFIKFTSSNGLQGMSDEEEKDSLVRLEKNPSGGYTIPPELMRKIEDVSGPKQKPGVYMTNSEVKKYMKSGNSDRTNFLNINEDIMEEEKNSFEKDIEQRFEDLMDQVIELRNLVEIYMEQEDLSPEFEDTYKRIEWVAGNYPFAPFNEEE